jgi:hypothetical protein
MTTARNLANGDADTAATLKTARTINGTSFNGSTNITITANTPNALTFNNAGTGAVSGTTFNGSAAQTISTNTIGAQPTLTSGTNIKTINGSSILGSGDLVVSGAAVSEVINIASSSATAVTYNTYIVITSGITLTLPATPTAGLWVNVSNRSTGNFTIGRNATNIMGLAEDMIIDVNASGIRLVYADATRGWVLI